MDHESTFKKIMNLYEDCNFFWNEKKIDCGDVLSLSGPTIEPVLRKASMLYKFLFEGKLNYGRKRMEGESKEIVYIKIDDADSFILYLLIIDIIEETTMNDITKINLNNFIK